MVTNDDELAARLRLMRNFGFEGYDEVGYIGTNGKMTEIAAAMGLTSLESLDEFIASGTTSPASASSGSFPISLVTAAASQSHSSTSSRRNARTGPNR